MEVKGIDLMMHGVDGRETKACEWSAEIYFALRS